MDYHGEEIAEIVRRYGLGEDEEHLIIPVRLADGSPARVFLLKRRFIRIVFSEGHHADYPLAEIVEAITAYQDMPLKESILLVHREEEEPQEHRKEEMNEEKDSD